MSGKSFPARDEDAIALLRTDPEAYFTHRRPARVVPVHPVIADDTTLDSLPVGSIVRDAEGNAVQCEKRPGAWFYPRERYQFTSDDIPLPALLLWHPDWEEGL